MAEKISHVLLLYWDSAQGANAQTIEENNMTQQINNADFRFRPAREADTENVLALYQAVKGRPFTEWDESYPGLTELQLDLSAGNLFVLEHEGTIVGTVSIAPENELDELDGWSSRRNAGEFARVAVHPSYQGQGLSARLVTEILAVMKARGVENVHITVIPHNLPAQKTYRRLGFVTVGRCELWGLSFDLMERTIE